MRRMRQVRERWGDAAFTVETEDGTMLDQKTGAQTEMSLTILRLFHNGVDTQTIIEVPFVDEARQMLIDALEGRVGRPSGIVVPRLSGPAI